MTGGHDVMNLEKASSSKPRPKGRGGKKKKKSKVQVGGSNPTVRKKAKRRLKGSRRESVSIATTQDIGRETVRIIWPLETKV